jgi:hypothetical protein
VGCGLPRLQNAANGTGDDSRMNMFDWLNLLPIPTEGKILVGLLSLGAVIFIGLRLVGYMTPQIKTRPQRLPPNYHNYKIERAVFIMPQEHSLFDVGDSQPLPGRTLPAYSERSLFDTLLNRPPTPTQLAKYEIRS